MGRRQVVGIRPRTGLSSAQANAAFRIILFLYYQIQAHDPGRAVLLHLVLADPFFVFEWRYNKSNSNLAEELKLAEIIRNFSTGNAPR